MTCRQKIAPHIHGYVVTVVLQFSSQENSSACRHVCVSYQTSCQQFCAASLILNLNCLFIIIMNTDYII